jgi:tetratricopeptide (TPR) repeat protein
MAVSTASPAYTQPALAEHFYATSWALADLLLQRRGGISALLSQPISPSPDLEAALRAHAKSLRGNATPATTPTEIDTQPAPAAEIDLALARLALFVNNLPAAGARLQHASPISPDAWALRGELALRQNLPAVARDAFRHALRLNTTSRRALWQLAVLEQNLPAGDPLPALERLVAADPAFDEARLVLGSHYLRLDRYQEALTQLRGIRSAPPGKADYFHSALAYAESRAAASTPLPASMISLE